MKITNVVVVGLLSLTIAHAHVWPSGGVSDNPIIPGQPVTITWDDALGASLVDIILWDGARGQETILAHRVNAGLRTFRWDAPADLVRGLYYRLAIRDAMQTTKVVFSQGFIAIEPLNGLVSSIESDGPRPAMMKMSPIPAYDNVRLEWETTGITSVEVQDAAGRMCLRERVDPSVHSIELDIQSIPSGVYALVSKTTLGIGWSQPLVIRH